MSSRRKIKRYWSKKALAALENPSLPESTVCRFFTEGLRHGGTGEDVCRAACRHPSLSKKSWLRMWLDPDFTYAAEANPVLALWLIEDPTYLERQKEMRRTYNWTKSTHWRFKENGELEKSTSGGSGGGAMKEVKFSPETEAYFQQAEEEGMRLALAEMAREDAEFEARLKKSLSAPPLDLNLRHVFEVVRRHVRGHLFLHYLLNHPELPYDLAMQLAKTDPDTRPALEKNPTVQLYRLEGKWDRELAEWDRKIEEQLKNNALFLQMELAMSQQPFSFFPPKEDESSTPVTNALTSLPDPLKK